MAFLVNCAIVSGFSVLFFIFYYLWSKRRLFLLAIKLPGPPALPIIGNGLSFLCDPKELLEEAMKLTDPYPSPLRLWLGPKLVIFVKDPDNLRTIFTSNKIMKKDHIYTFLEPFLGRGLLTSSGVVHKMHRKLLQPMFSPKILEGYSYLFQKHAISFVKSLKSNLNGKTFDVLQNLHDCAFSSNMDILVQDTNEHSVDYKDIPKYIKKFYQIFVNRVTKVWLHPNFLYEKTDLYKEQENIRNVITTMVQEVIDSKQPDILRKLEKKERKGEIDIERLPSMFEMMIEMKMKDDTWLSDQDIIDNMITLIATSQDTQSSTIAFTLMMLGMHPAIQDRVVAELQEVLGDFKRTIEFADLEKLKYLDMCIKESMRLFAVGPFLVRQTESDFELENFVIPSGCTVVLSIFNTHRDPNHYEKPLEYYPEHFLPDAVKKRHPYAYVPFSAGPRRCIAQQYAYTNMKILIGTVLQHYVIEADGKVTDVQLMCDLSIRPINGHLIRIKKRCS